MIFHDRQEQFLRSHFPDHVGDSLETMATFDRGFFVEEDQASAVLRLMGRPAVKGASEEQKP